MTKKQHWLAPQISPYGTNTGRLTSPLLSVLPQRVRCEESKLAFEFQYLLQFPEDSEYTIAFFDFAS